MKRTLILMISALWCIQGASAAAQTGEAFIEVKVSDRYKYRDDGKPGREVFVDYRGPRQLRSGKFRIVSRQGTEMVAFTTQRNDSIPLLLPEGIGVSARDTVTIALMAGREQCECRTVVPAMRHWTVYIYPHSHVDIGYTNTQQNVEFIHKRNLEVAMELAEQTRDYPEDARFRWNPEVTWPIERYMASASEAQRQRLLDAIRRGDIAVDAGYVNTNTSACSDEELLELFRYGKELERQTGVKVETMVQVDIPGMSWGVVPAANHYGIRYCLSLFNGYDRTGLSSMLNFKPFWWIGPDGVSKVLFLQPGSYNPGALAKGKDFWPLMAGQTDTSKLLRVVRTDNPRANFIDGYLAEKLPQLEADPEYIYPIFPMTWCMADNTPVDVDLPEAVRSWNEEYAFPHLKICTGTEMMEAFAAYGDRIPQMKGDFTEYWTDGLGSGAAKTGRGRVVKETLVQAEILWAMLHPGEPMPEETYREAWRNIILSTEHTWAFMQPDKQPISDEINRTKYGYFDRAAELTDRAVEMAVAGVAKEGADRIAVFNTNSWPQSGLVRLSAERSAAGDRVTDAAGRVIPSQRLTSGELVFVAEEVPALGSAIFRLSAGPKTEPATVADSAYVLDNGRVRLTLDPLTGDVVSLIYGGAEYVDRAALVGWNSFRYLKGGQTTGSATKPVNVRITRKEWGPVVQSFRVEADAEGCEGLTREVMLLNGSETVYFRNVVDKRAVLDKEGIHFGFAFDVPQGVTRVNVPWGVMELEKDQLKAANRNWIAMQRWLDISSAEKGVTWCPMNAVNFESGDMTANIIGGAFGSPEWIRQLRPSSIVYSWALNNHWHTNFPLSQSGKITFEYRVRPHAGGYDAASANRFGMESFRPLVAVPVGEDFTGIACPVTLSGADEVFLSTYRTIDRDRSLVRLLSQSGSDETVALRFGAVRPASVVAVTEGSQGERKTVSPDAIVIPANGSITLEINWR